MSKEAWPPSRVFHRRGVAFYDGILIRSDSIYNPRPDRVLPIFREEQIFVSRMMRPRLQGGWRVLDVGTGSGIYAIEAARRKCCAVAIDNNPRACRFLRSNAEWNTIPIVERSTQIGEGEIAVLEDEFNNNFSDDPFDAVVLSPSYTPTPPGFEYLVAPHAAAGPDGLENFRKQIKNVPRLLKAGGICFGNQLSVVRRPSLPASLDGKSCAEIIQDQNLSACVEVISLIKEAFAGECTIRCVPIFTDLYPTAKFIEDEFAGVMGLINKDKATKDKFDQGRDNLAEKFPYFALVYYEIHKEGDGRVILGQTPWAEILEEEREDFTWARRMRVHRAVVEHRLPQGTTPLPVFITSGTTDSLLSYESAVAISDETSTSIHEDTTSSSNSAKRELEGNRILKKNPLALIDKEIESQQLGELFSIIYFDTMPIHPKPGGQYEHYLERRVWVNGVGRANDADQRTIKVAREILERWHKVTLALQSAKCGIGLHPAFGNFASDPRGWRWPEITSTDYPLEGGQRQVAIQVAKSVIKKKFDIWLNNESSEDTQRKFIEVEELFYSKSTLNELEAKSYQDNFGEYDRRLEELEKRLREQVPEVLGQFEQKDLRHELGQLDLYACQLVMHEAIHEGLRDVIKRSLQGTQDDPWADESIVYSIPLGMIFFERGASTRDFPPFYKGGLWAWFVPNSRRKLRHEEAANHLLQIMWVLLTASYSAISEQAYERVERNKVTEYFAHEVKKVSNAITSQMIRPAHELFQIQQSTNSSEQFDGKLGRIEMSNEMQGVWKEEDMGITFFQQSAASAGSMINLWCQDPNLIDAVGVVGREYENIKSLLDACWRVCINTLPVYALARSIFIDATDPLKARESIEKLKRDEDALKGLFWNEVIVEGASQFPCLVWRGPEADDTPWLVRLFLALLNNCAAHSDPSSPIRIRFTQDETELGRFDVEVSNNMRSKEGNDTEAIIEKLVRRGVDAGLARQGLTELLKHGLALLAQAAPVSDKVRVAKFGTRDVVENCVSHLKGNVTWPEEYKYSSGSSAYKYIVKLNFLYKGEK